MLDFVFLRGRGILIIRPHGPLEERDFEKISSEIDPFIASHGKLKGIMLRAKEFQGWDSFSAFLSHLRFVAEHHQRIVRIAVVTDLEFLKMVPPMVDNFVEPEIKQFDSGEVEEAFDWLENHDNQKQGAS